MKVLSLFDGISCARVALERVGIKVDEYYASEIDKYALQISKKNYPEIIHMGDVKNPIQRYLECRAISFPSKKHYFVDDIDLLIGGSPCQDLSIAKKNRKGLDGERSGLFWEFIRWMKEIKPKYFILENVNSMPKETKAIITKEMGVEPIMINASLVSAQNRKRLFWTNIPNVTQPEDRGILLKDILEEDVDESFFIKKETIESIINWNNAQAGRIRGIHGKSVTLQAHGGGTGAKTGLYAVKIVGRRIGKDGHRKDYDKSINIEQRVEINNNPQKTNALSTVQKDNALLDNQIIRKFTPIECERLQGLPDNYTEGISNSQRYKCLGNAFNVDVVAHILSFIKQ